MFPEITYNNGNLEWDPVADAIKYRIYKNDAYPTGENWVIIYEDVNNQCSFNYPPGDYEVKGQYQADATDPKWSETGKKKIITVPTTP
jgi:hypothetical protein